MGSNIDRAGFGSGLICHRAQTHTELFYVSAAGRRNGLCERRGTHVLALKHAWTQK